MDGERDHWLAGLIDDARAHRLDQWQKLREQPGSEDFFRFLRDFSRSSDFRSHPAYYRHNVWKIIEACEQNSELREQLFVLAGGRHSCEDRLLLVLSQMQTRVFIHLQTAGLTRAQSQAPLMALGRALFRLDEVDRIAARRLQSMRFMGGQGVDDIEVYLAYRVRLAETLGLPGQPDSMHFETFSGLSASDLNNARIEVLRAETRERLAQALADRDFWQAYLHRCHPDRFEALAEPFHERLAVYAQEAASTGEQLYLERSNALMHELLAAERALVLELTQAAYAGVAV